MRKNKGFTLIELLIVIAIIAIIAAVVFVALDPMTRFQNSRDAARWQDISAIMSAIKVDQVDNGGNYVAAIQTIVSGSTAGDVFMITDGTPGTPECDFANANCLTNVTAETSAGDHCVDLSALVTEGYLGDVPVSPNGAGTWTNQNPRRLSGYTLQANSTGIITIRACEGEGGTELTISR